MFGQIVSAIRTVLGKNRKIKAPPWYESQGDDLTECGRAVTIMALRWGAILDFEVAPVSGIWYNTTIRDKLTERKLTNRFCGANYVKELTVKEAMIVRIRALGVFPHYVFVTYRTGQRVIVSDPLSGSRIQDTDELLKEMVGNIHILVIHK